MAELKGFWRNGEIILLEGKKANFSKKFRLHNESRAERMNERFEWNERDIVAFELKVVNGEEVAVNVHRTGDPPYRERR